MDGARDQLLAGAALADDEHRRVGRRGVRDLLVDRRSSPACGRAAPAASCRGPRPVAAPWAILCSARSTSPLSSVMLNGLLTKSNAPSRTASTAFSSSPKPVTMMTGVAGRALAHRAQHVDAVEPGVQLEIADDEVERLGSARAPAPARDRWSSRFRDRAWSSSSCMNRQVPGSSSRTRMRAGATAVMMPPVRRRGPNRMAGRL